MPGVNTCLRVCCDFWPWQRHACHGSKTAIRCMGYDPTMLLHRRQKAHLDPCSHRCKRGRSARSGAVPTRWHVPAQRSSPRLRGGFSEDFLVGFWTCCVTACAARSTASTASGLWSVGSEDGTTEWTSLSIAQLHTPDGLENYLSAAVGPAGPR